MKRRRGRQSSQFFEDKFFYYRGELYLRKRKKSKNKCDCSNLVLVDQISEMPCEILVNVLSLLPLKEAVATSILSRRWRCVWKSTMKLTFDDINFLAGSNDQDFALTFMELEEKLKDEKIHNYVNWVNRVVEQHRGSKIEQLRACFYLDLCYSSSIDEWIRFAMEKSVEILELDLSPGTSFPLFSKHAVPCYKTDGFSQYLLCLKQQSASGQLHSDIPNLRSCVHNIGFKSLKVLHLRNVGVTGEDLEYFLSYCPVLERLSVIVSKNLVSLRVVGPSSALKYLMIENCPRIKRVEIRDANIVSFSYIGYDAINLLLGNLPMLVDISLVKRFYTPFCISRAFTQLSCYVSQIQFLTMDIKGENCRSLTFPRLSNLKYLELIVCAQYDWSLHDISSFLKASPYLPRLVLKLTYMVFTEPGEIKEVVENHHHNVKVVEIVGYRGITCAIQHVKYLIENAVALEKIVINPVQLRFLPPRVDREIERSKKEEEKARDHAKQHLKPKLNLPSTVEFVCM